MKADTSRRGVAIETIDPQARGTTAVGDPSGIVIGSPIGASGSPAVFWPLRHPVDSPLLGNIPFLFWLIETTRPRKIVQLGLGDGLIHMSLCQAVERLGGQSLCVGVDLDGCDWPEQLRRQHQAEYSAFSTLIHGGWPSDGAGLVRGADLLILNAPLDRDQCQSISDHWLSQLSNKAVVLTIDAARVLGHPDLRNRLIEGAASVLAAGPFSPAGEMIDVTLLGEVQPERLRHLVDAGETSPIRLTARQVFKTLGKGVEDACRLRELQAQNNALRSSAQTLKDAGAAAKATSAAQAGERADELSAELDAAKRQAEAANAQIDELRRQNAQLEEAHATRIEDIAVLMREHKLRQKETADEAARLRDEVERLTRKNAEQDRAHKAQLAQLRETQEAALAELQGQLVAMQALHEDTLREIFASTSWRVTRPMRGLKAAISRRPAD